MKIADNKRIVTNDESILSARSKNSICGSEKGLNAPRPSGPKPRRRCVFRAMGFGVLGCRV